MSVEEIIRQWEARTQRVALELRRRVRHRHSPSPAPRPALTVPAISSPKAEPAPGSDVQIISSLDELDEKLREIDAAWAISDDAMRKVFRTFKMVAADDLPADPVSREYSDWQFDLYRLISARDYQVNNEHSGFPVDPNRPFPYYTESSETVGHQLMGIGFIIQTMGLPAGASVLDMGPGWGNTTVALARMGYQVTAVDIDPTFVELIQARAAKFSLSVDARPGTFLEIDQLERVFDAVLFFESFHHCSDHRALLKKLAGVIAPGGRVFFAAEPIDDTFPMPWGVRLDGESLWAIRQNGWLELGFQESYFLRTVQHLGWLATKHVNPATHLGVIFEARRADHRYEMSTFRLPPDEDATWAPPDTDVLLRQRYSARSSVLSLEQGLGRGTLVIEAVNPAPHRVPFRVQHGRHAVRGVAEPQRDTIIRLPYDSLGERLVIDATTWRPCDVLGSEDCREVGLGVRTISFEAARPVRSRIRKTSTFAEEG